jgi:hypothetical protein
MNFHSASRAMIANATLIAAPFGFKGRAQAGVLTDDLCLGPELRFNGLGKTVAHLQTCLDSFTNAFFHLHIARRDGVALSRPGGGRIKALANIMGDKCRGNTR